MAFQQLNLNNQCFSSKNGNLILETCNTSSITADDPQAFVLDKTNKRIKNNNLLCLSTQGLNNPLAFARCDQSDNNQYLNRVTSNGQIKTSDNYCIGIDSSGDKKLKKIACDSNQFIADDIPTFISNPQTPNSQIATLNLSGKYIGFTDTSKGGSNLSTMNTGTSFKISENGKYDGSIKVNSLCVTAGENNGDPITLQDCISGAPRQSFNFNNGGKIQFYDDNAKLKCLDVKYYDGGSNEQLFVNDCSSNTLTFGLPEFTVNTSTSQNMTCSDALNLFNNVVSANQTNQSLRKNNLTKAQDNYNYLSSRQSKALSDVDRYYDPQNYVDIYADQVEWYGGLIKCNELSGGACCGTADGEKQKCCGHGKSYPCSKCAGHCGSHGGSANGKLSSNQMQSSINNAKTDINNTVSAASRILSQLPNPNDSPQSNINIQCCQNLSFENINSTSGSVYFNNISQTCTVNGDSDGITAQSIINDTGAETNAEQTVIKNYVDSEGNPVSDETVTILGNGLTISSNSSSSEASKSSSSVSSSSSKSSNKNLIIVLATVLSALVLIVIAIIIFSM